MSLYTVVWEGSQRGKKNTGKNIEDVKFVRGEEVDPALGITLQEAAGGRNKIPDQFDGEKFMKQTKLCPTKSAISGWFEAGDRIFIGFQVHP